MTDPTATAGFLEAICAAPEDDTPRLIFADWLADHGDEDRAEFIRVQCRLADMEEDDWRPSEPEYEIQETLRRRERELLHAGRYRWLAPLVKALTGYPYGPHDQPAPEEAFANGRFTADLIGNGTVFRRGFVEQIRCASEAWFRHAEAILASTPLTHVELTDVPPAFQDKDHVWLEGRRRWWKWDKRFGGLGAYLPPLLLAAEWGPRITFSLPPA